MKKNLVMRIAAVVLMCTLVTACFASSTFAKYTSAAKGSDTVTVAKWSIEVNDADIVNATGSPASVDFALFDTIKDSDGNAETDVTSGKIAPGTQGAFAVAKIENTSDVTANVKVTMKLTSDSTNIPPLQYNVGSGDNWTTWTKGTEITIIDKTGDNALAIGGTIAATDVQWRWAFNDTGVDNAYGINPADLNVELVITADQKD